MDSVRLDNLLRLWLKATSYTVWLPESQGAAKEPLQRTRHLA